MVTASHNPPQDNGYKVYLGDGAQIAPPADEEIAAEIAGVGPPATCRSATAARRSGRSWPRPTCVAILGALPAAGSARHADRLHAAARRRRAAVPWPRSSGPASPPPHVVAAQAEPDPDFSTVDRPNPEEPGHARPGAGRGRGAWRRRAAGQRPRRRPARRRHPGAGRLAPAARRRDRRAAGRLPARALPPTRRARCWSPPWPPRRCSCRMAEAAGAALRRDAVGLQVDHARARRGARPPAAARLRGGAGLRGLRRRARQGRHLGRARDGPAGGAARSAPAARWPTGSTPSPHASAHHAHRPADARAARRRGPRRASAR